MARAPVYKVNVATSLNLRKRPSMNADILVKLQNGQLVAQIASVRRSNWAQVFADTPGFGGYVGYVSMNYLAPVNEKDLNGAWSDNDTDDDEGETDRLPFRTELPQPANSASPSDLKNGWNPNVPEQNYHKTKKFSARRAGIIDQVIIHVTGSTDFKSVRDRFMEQSASAHYLVMPDGALHQFVAENQRAWHSGIKSNIDRIYARRDGTWRKYKRYFGGTWAQPHYPAGSVFLDASLNRLPADNRAGAALVARADGGFWTDYAYFDARWGATADPLGYQGYRYNPNDRSIGIEVLSIGAKTPSEAHYTTAMYQKLAELVDDICTRHNIPKTRRHVCGHEDVNPVERWGWDPGQGFEWNKLFR